MREDRAKVVSPAQPVAASRQPFAVELARFLLLTLAYLSLVPAVAWYLAYLELGDSRWWMFVLNSGAAYLFLPAPVVLVAGLLTRRWSLLIAALVPLLVAVTLFGPLLVPRALKAADVPDAAPRLSVMTFNVHAHNDEFDAAQAAILSSGADVVALQELSTELSERLRAGVAGTYPYFEYAPSPGGSGLGVLSRYPLAQLSRDSGWTAGRNPLGVLMSLPWGDTVLINVHNLSTSRTIGEWPAEIEDSMRQRERISNMITDFVSATPLPVVVVGDFNTTERSTAYRLLRENLSDAWLEAGFGLGHTFPGGPLAPTPFGLTPPSWLLRIDYVFYSPELTAFDARIGPWDGASDHRPVIAQLAWRE